MEKKFSEKFKITGTQEDFDFVDIRLWTDQELFIDPSLIMRAQHKENQKGNKEMDYATRAHKSLQSFFSTFFEIFKDIHPSKLIKGKDQGAKGINRDEKIFNLLKYSAENNALRLGYTVGKSKGTGCSPEMIYDFFANMKFKHPKMLDFIKEPFHTSGFINEIGEDRSTDLTVSIILDVLCDFTLFICNKYAIPTEKFQQFRNYWDPNEKMWKTRDYDLPIDEKGDAIVLVPKSFVTKEFRYNANYVLKNYILVEKLDELKTQYPSKEWNKKDALKKIRLEHPDSFNKDLVLEYFVKRPDSYEGFMNRVNNGVLGTHLGLLTDAEIEKATNKFEEG
ncbi:hypothetical protein LGQ25_000371 [Listeria monocytogenes]|uniref:hypothetical protein n=1 Tax=Listeria monocytogenes TaxID=1639 RepID=UPI0010D6CCE3|nr:hypothetical protein [Listeria monocytogenes]EAD2801160.1 hypothetical protein [Listeria monocytogenes]EAE2396276.1 hypothetical protein [Listeria monocytogenes]EAG3567975.1 hypothetical protein [Listeria monocytogenes]EAG5904463.1 hypothetical protein [Listeria monocytogenes]EBH4176273.1 hypothetical protein [Listeria monocytogenes]